jgi:hypothetical protein
MAEDRVAVLPVHVLSEKISAGPALRSSFLNIARRPENSGRERTATRFASGRGRPPSCSSLAQVARSALHCAVRPRASPFLKQRSFQRTRPPAALGGWSPTTQAAVRRTIQPWPSIHILRRLSLQPWRSTAASEPIAVTSFAQCPAFALRQSAPLSFDNAGELINVQQIAAARNQPIRCPVGALRSGGASSSIPVSLSTGSMGRKFPRSAHVWPQPVWLSRSLA